MNIETELELKEFIGSLLDLKNPKNKLFLEELLRRIQKPSHNSNVTVYVKPDLEETKTQSARTKQAKSLVDNDNRGKQNKKAGFSLFTSDNSNFKASSK